MNPLSNETSLQTTQRPEGVILPIENVFQSHFKQDGHLLTGRLKAQSLSYTAPCKLGQYNVPGQYCIFPF